MQTKLKQLMRMADHLQSICEEYERVISGRLKKGFRSKVKEQGGKDCL